MGTMSAQQVAGWLGMLAAVLVAVVGMTGELRAPGEVQAAGEVPHVVTASGPSLVALLPVPTADAVRPVITYEVEPGDTLSGIAEAHGTTVEALLERNGLEGADRLEVGQTLDVPASHAD